MNISAKKLENIFVLLFHLSLIPWMIKGQKGVFEQIALTIFSLYLIVFIYNCNRIITKPKPDIGKYFRYRKSFIGLDFYWLIPLQIFLTIQGFQTMSSNIMWLIISLWTTILIKGIIRQIFGDFYVLLTEDSIEINENRKYLVRIDDIIQVEKQEHKYRFEEKKDKKTLIIFNRISSVHKADFKTEIDELIGKYQIKTVYNNNL